MRKVFVLDTNVLLHDPGALFRFEDNDVILPITIIEELDRFKKLTEMTGRNARQVSRSLDDLNRESPFQAVFFALDADTIDAAGQAVLSANAEIMKRYASWVVTVEGHCDERGTAEYNLALGERRALAARNYLVSLGIPGERLRTVSYGKEFPFDPGKTDEAYARNRRAHFVVTAK